MCIRECINIGNLFVTDSVRAPAAKPTELGQRGSSYQSFLSTSAKIRTSDIESRHLSREQVSRNEHKL